MDRKRLIAYGTAFKLKLKIAAHLRAWQASSRLQHLCRWRAVSSEVIVKSFNIMGISNAMDSMEED